MIDISRAEVSWSLWPLDVSEEQREKLAQTVRAHAAGLELPERELRAAFALTARMVARAERRAELGARFHWAWLSAETERLRSSIPSARRLLLAWQGLRLGATAHTY